MITSGRLLCFCSEDSFFRHGSSISIVSTLRLSSYNWIARIVLFKNCLLSAVLKMKSFIFWYRNQSQQGTTQDKICDSSNLVLQSEWYNRRYHQATRFLSCSFLLLHQRHKFDHHWRLLLGLLVGLEGFQLLPIYQWCIEKLKKNEHQDNNHNILQ